MNHYNEIKCEFLGCTNEKNIIMEVKGGNHSTNLLMCETHYSLIMGDPEKYVINICKDCGHSYISLYKKNNDDRIPLVSNKIESACYDRFHVNIDLCYDCERDQYCSGDDWG